MAIIDANYILRYLLKDIEEQYIISSNIIENTEVTLLNEVLAEVVYVLQKVYKVNRELIYNALGSILNYQNIYCYNKDVLRLAIEKYKDTNLDFVDCILFSYSKIENENIYTFDKKLKNTIDEDF
ncbi:PIN domain-containing protein [Thiospirochaeta perfilievii]|uniref:PIN domain-containing protein n=1 Tax=Thiospirochaeta perfilievii TaxID=252967 RepID=A0A5C1QDZ4_9SPIO|nr:PIN domain-containing protein [Thiospirochaeta perfilievii]QEN05607.1 PIN domain-containing protein [Thiospirochaeta perfilievii]